VLAVVQYVRAAGDAERAAFTLPGGRLIGWSGLECCTDRHSAPDRTWRRMTLARLFLAPAVMCHDGPDQGFIGNARLHWFPAV
jgi:hypothetical protein